MTTENQRPNLLFIMTDQQRFDAMSCAGNTVLETPNMDRLAREGVMFNNCYTGNPVCVPARSILLTGRSCYNTKVLVNKDCIGDHVPNLPTFDSILVDHGYTGEYYGKWHTPYQFTECYQNDVKVVGELNQVLEGLNEIDAYNAWMAQRGAPSKDPGPDELFANRNKRPYSPVPPDSNIDKLNVPLAEKRAHKPVQSTQHGCLDTPPRTSYAAFTAHETLEALERLHASGEPFTLTSSFDPPHPPFFIQEPYFSMYPPQSIPVPETIDDPMTDSPYRERWQKEGHQLYRDADNVRNFRSIYYAMVREVDDFIGEILDKLDEYGIADNTLVVFVSDHGEMMGDHGMHSKMIFYEASAHVPFIMRFPGRIQPGTVVNQPVSLMDVCPTILDYLAMPVPKSNGMSLRSVVDGGSHERDVVSYSYHAPNYMLRSGDLKLIMTEARIGKACDGLYDLATDPNEVTNLLASDDPKHRALADEMQQRLVAWLRENEPDQVSEIEQRQLYAANL